MFKPRVNQEKKHYCQNPTCGAKLPAKANKKYCDKICLAEHNKILKAERRPKELHCSACGNEIDVLSREPNTLKGPGPFFCNQVCADRLRRETGAYKAMSEKGNQAIKDYKEKHGQLHNYKARAEAIAENNKKTPPKAKYFVRMGKVWGYDARAIPDEGGTGYRLMLTEYPEFGIVRAKTFKQCLALMRQRVIEMKDTEPTLEESPLTALTEPEFEELYNAFQAGLDSQNLTGYQAIAGHYSDQQALMRELDIEMVRRYASK
jgi:hypothetical protein